MTEGVRNGVVRKNETARNVVYWTIGLSFTALAILAAVKCSGYHTDLSTAENDLDAAEHGFDAATSTLNTLTHQLANAQQGVLDANCSITEFPAYAAAVETGTCANITGNSSAVDRLSAAGFTLDLPPVDTVRRETITCTEYGCIAWNGWGDCVEHGQVAYTCQLDVTDDYQGPFWVSGKSNISRGLCGAYARDFSAASFDSTVTGVQSMVSFGYYIRTDKVYSGLHPVYSGPSADSAKFLMPHDDNGATRKQVAGMLIPYFVKLCQVVFSDARSYGIAYLTNAMHTLLNSTIPSLTKSVSAARTSLSLWSDYVSGNKTLRAAAQSDYSTSLKAYLLPMFLVPIAFGFLAMCAVKYSEYKDSQKEVQQRLATS